MPDITRVRVALTSGPTVNVASPDDTVLVITEVGNDLNISNTGAQIIASFSKSAVAYWTTDLAEIS